MAFILLLFIFCGSFAQTSLEKLSATEKKQVYELLNNPEVKVTFNTLTLDDELKKVKSRYQKIHELSVSHKELIDTLMPLFWDLCPKYYKLKRLQDSILRPKKDSILQTLIIKPMGENTAFLKQLIEQRNNQTLTTFERAIAPIFNLKKDSVGIYAETSEWNEHADSQLLNDHPEYKQLSYKMVFRKHMIFFDGILKESQKENLYIYSTSKKYISSIEKFGMYKGECLEYFYYNLELIPEMLHEKEFLFTSKFDLDIIYTNNDFIGKRINAQYSKMCVDCPSNYSEEKVVGKLKGYPNLYFTAVLSTDFAIEKLFTPLRGLYYVDDTYVIPVWFDSIDYFGCSCL